MKKMLLLISLCLVPTLSNAMQILPEHANQIKETIDKKQKNNKKEEAKKARRNELKSKNIIQKNILETTDELEKIVKKNITNLDDKLKKRIGQTGQEARVTIKSATGDAFKGLFCSTLAILGGAILYKTLCSDDKDTDNDPEKQKNRNIKLLAGTALLLVGGGLGFYVFG